jgi:hypothetical protein
MAGTGSRVAFLYAFDLLEFNGRDLRDLPLDARRKTPIALWRDGGPVSGFRSTSKAATAMSSSNQPATWALRASSPSAAIDRIVPGDLLIGSRSRTRTRQPRSG